MTKTKNIHKQENKKEKVIQTAASKYLKFFLKHPYLIISSLTFIIYFQVVFFDYVFYDDQYFFMSNPKATEKLSNFVTAVTTPYMQSSYYRPIANLSYYIDVQVAGDSSFSHHLMNLLLHSITCCFVFALFKQLKYSQSTSLIISLLFAVHPINTNSVGWIVGRNDMFVTLFTLISLIYFLKFTEKEKTWYLILHLLTLLLAVFSKEIAMIIPLLAFFYWFVLLKKKEFSPKSLLLIISWVIPFVMFFVIKRLLRIPMTDGFFSISHIFINLPVIPEIVSKAIFPFNLMVVPIFKPFTTISGILFIIILTTYVYINRKKLNTNKILFGSFWFVILFVPSLFVHQVAIRDFFNYLDCRAYLPLFGLLIVFIELLPKPIFDLTRKNSLYVFLSVFLIFSMLTFAYSRNYKDRKSFWINATKSNPDIAKNYLTNDPKEMIKKLELAQKKNKEGDHAGSMELINELIKKDSLNDKYFASRGLFYLRKNDLKSAFYDFNQAIALSPTELKPYFQRAYIRVKWQQYKDAIKDYDKILDGEKDNYFAYYQRALCKYYIKYFNEALRDCSEAIALKPEVSQHYILRGGIYLELKNKAEACKDFQMAQSLGNPEAKQYIQENCIK